MVVEVVGVVDVVDVVDKVEALDALDALDALAAVEINVDVNSSKYLIVVSTDFRTRLLPAPQKVVDDNAQKKRGLCAPPCSATC